MFGTVANGTLLLSADNGKMRAPNESYALKMNIIVILVTITIMKCVVSKEK